MKVEVPVTVPPIHVFWRLGQGDVPVADWSTRTAITQESGVQSHLRPARDPKNNHVPKAAATLQIRYTGLDCWCLIRVPLFLVGNGDVEEEVSQLW